MNISFFMVLPRDFKWNFLKAIHDFGYVYNDGLAQLFCLHPVTICRVVDQLVADGFVRLAGMRLAVRILLFTISIFIRRQRRRSRVRKSHLSTALGVPADVWSDPRELFSRPSECWSQRGQKGAVSANTLCGSTYGGGLFCAGTQ